MLTAAMEKSALKRVRSAESENVFIHQSKVHVNNKLLAANDAAKMTQIHEKTLDMLFKGARIEKKQMTASVVASVPLWERIILAGNGKIDFAGVTKPADFPSKRHKAKCCERDTFVQVECASCSMAMCENCGISCSECRVFICNKCVVLFGCGTMDRPICEKCVLYN